MTADAGNQFTVKRRRGHEPFNYNELETGVEYELKTDGLLFVEYLSVVQVSKVEKIGEEKLEEHLDETDELEIIAGEEAMKHPSDRGISIWA